MAQHGISATGLITSERARYAKPDPKIFTYALDQTGFQPGEVIHIGDSLNGDFRCATSIGIESIWLNRHSLSSPEDVQVASDLKQARAIIARLQ